MPLGQARKSKGRGDLEEVVSMAGREAGCAGLRVSDPVAHEKKPVVNRARAMATTGLDQPKVKVNPNPG